MTPGFVIALILIVLIVLAVSFGVRTVPQGEEWLVERFGKYRRTLQPGLSVIIPFMDLVAYKIVTKDILLDINRQEVITRDNAVISTNAIAFIKVIDGPTAVYGVVDFSEAVRNLVQTSLRSIIGEMDLDAALSSREQIKARLRDMLAPDVHSWGLNLKSVEIQDIQPSETMQVSMEQQAAAERDRKATITRAEGAKQASILEAEGRLESAKRDAEAEVTLANASKQAIQLIRETTDDDRLSLHFLLGQRYVDAIDSLGSNPNSKFVLLPADLHESVRGILGGSRALPGHATQAATSEPAKKQAS